MGKKQFRYILIIISFIFLITGCDKHKDMNCAMGAENADSKGKDIAAGELKENEISFSKTDYFYSQDISVKIISKKPATIYYTTDGKEPDEKAAKYKDEIKLSAYEDLNVVSVKARAYFEDGTKSEVIVHSYFLSTKIKDRFNMLVFSVTTDPDNLFDYTKGIFVTGKIRDDYVKKHPGVRVDPKTPANYSMRGKKSERPVYLEILKPDGSNIASQAAGIRTYGGWSRDSEQKSIKIFTRKEYDKKNNKLKYEFFPDKTAANGDGTIIDSFKRLVLRNCGNDNGIAFIRDELFETLASQAGYPDYEAVRPAVLFLNGEYRGFYWLHEVYNDDEYFKENYGDFKGKFEILAGEETKKETDEDGGNKEVADEYNKMYSDFSSMDLTKDENYKKLCKVVDVDNYLSYFALHIYNGDDDWLDNNYKTYRYYVKQGEKYRGAPFDGKWRYLLHDLDHGFGIYGNPTNIEDYIGDDGKIKNTCPLFGKLMQREDCREIFIKKTADLINGAFAPENIKKVMYKMNASREDELKNMDGKGLFSGWFTYDQLEYNLENILYFGTERAAEIIDKYQEYFHLGDIYQLRAQPVTGCKLKINSFLTNDYFEGKYYSNYDTEISAVIPAGKELDYWTCNGKKVYSKKLVIKKDDIKTGEVAVTFVLKEQCENPHLIISELSKGKNYVEIYNPYKESISTKGYTMTDDVKNKEKQKLPVQTLASGEKVQITIKNQILPLFGKKSKLMELKSGKTIILSNKNELIDKVKIPNMKKEHIYRRDLSTMRFYEMKE